MGTIAISILHVAYLSHEDCEQDGMLPFKNLSDVWHVHFDAMLGLVSLKGHVTESAGGSQLLDRWTNVILVQTMLDTEAHCRDPEVDFQWVSHTPNILRVRTRQDRHDARARE
jgi:hypothetical protein